MKTTEESNNHQISMDDERVLGEVAECYKKACNLASRHVESLARRILAERSELNEFIMGMGTYFFSLKDDDDNIDAFSGEEWMEPLVDFICEWDRELKITGEAMRFTAMGDKVTEW